LKYFIPWNVSRYPVNFFPAPSSGEVKPRLISLLRTEHYRKEIMKSSPAGFADDARTELANIGPKEIRKRLLLGAFMVAVGVALAVIFLHAGVSRGWYWALFLPFWMGTLALFQARKKT
jgi:hypothetical protein